VTNPASPAAARSSRTARKWLVLAVKLAIVLLVVWFMRRALVQAWQEIGRQPLRLSPAWLAVSGVLYAIGMLPEGLFWHRTLRELGQPATLGDTLRAFFIGHLGKYVPGKAMVIVLRSGLLRCQPRETGLVVAAVFLSTLAMMSVGACLAAALMAVYFAGNWLLTVASLGMMLAAGLPTLPPVFARLAALAGVARGNPTALAKLAAVRYRLLAGGWVIMIVGWLFMAESLWAVLRAMGCEAALLEQLPLCLAAVTLAVVGGFVAMIPGGLGIREAVLLELLGQHLGRPGLGLVAAAVLRIVWLVTEVVVSIIVYGVGSRR
jgi:glycosyltransferase 2 family protein